MSIITNPFKKDNSIEKENQKDRESIKQSNMFDAGVRDDQTYLYQQEQRAEIIRWLQDLDDELQSLVNTLLGLEEREGKLFQVGEPLCNTKFITQVVVPQCRPLMSRNIINSKLDERTILDTLKYTIADIIDAMSDNYKNYGIDFTDFDLILRLIKNTIKAGLYRAIKGFNKQMDSTMIKRIESFSEQDNNNKKGLMGGLKF